MKVVPDKYNTGANENTAVKKFTSTQGEIIADGLFLTVREDKDKDGKISNRYYFLNGRAKQQAGCKDKVFIRDYDFSDLNFTVQAAYNFSCNKYITFENCKFKGFRNDAAAPGEKRAYFIFNNCTFCGGVNNSYITLNNCRIGGFTSDAMNPLREFYASNLYVCDLMTQGLEGEVHIDGIQIYGDQRSRNNEVNGKWISKVETGEIHYDNVRFEIPSIHHDNNNPKTAVNACVMFQLEFSDVNNVSFENLFVNGGGKWYPLYMDHGKNNERSRTGIWSHINLVLRNVMVSNNFGTIFYPSVLEDAVIRNVNHHDSLFVSSVWKDGAGVVHLIVSNDTNSDKAFVVKTNRGTKQFSIPHCPSNWALGGEVDGKVNPGEKLTDKNGRSYKTYSFSDMPFDLEYTVSGNPDFVVCYQAGEQIRYVSFDKRKHFLSEIVE